MDEQGHLTNEERAAYWQRTLPPPELLALSDHLQECARCREQLRRDQPAAGSAASVGYEDLVELMEDDLDPLRRRELAERIGSSPAAAAELLNLLQFRDEMNALPRHDYSVAPPSRSQRWMPGWALPLAAGLAIGCAFLWLTSALHKPGAGLTLIDHEKSIVVRPNGQIPILGPLPPELQDSLRDAVSLGKVDRPAIARDLAGAREALAGATAPQASFRAIAPVGTVVEAERPSFRWSKAPNATGYRVNLLPEGGGEVVSSPLLPASASSWTPAESLSPNETYEWEVEALRDGELLRKTPAPPEPEARFRVLDPATRAQLKQLREDWGASHLLMGLAYARAGLLEEARREFAELARENPQSPLPKKLLAGLTNPTK